MKTRLVISILLCVLIAFIPDVLLMADEIQVTTTDDAGPGSFREAIQTANPGDIVTFSGVDFVELFSGPLAIDKDLTIQGNATRIFRSDSADLFPILNIEKNAVVSLNGLILSGGNGGIIESYGIDSRPSGGVNNQGKLTMTGCSILDNTAAEGTGGFSDPLFPGYIFFRTGGAGGGIYNTGTMTMFNCEIRGNRSGSARFAVSLVSDFGGPGGGICNTGKMTLTKCAILFNRTSDGTASAGAPGSTSVSGGGGHGGGIYNVGDLEICDSIVSGNATGNGFSGEIGGHGGNGGGIMNYGNLVLKRSTIDTNQTGSGGNSISRNGGEGGSGGAICNYGNSTVQNCTFYMNKTGNGGMSSAVGDGGFGGPGGACANFGTMMVTNCTIVRNSTGNGGIATIGSNGGFGLGGGFFSTDSSETKIHNSIMADNYRGEASSGTQPNDTYGFFRSLGFNIMENGYTIHFLKSGDITGEQVNLGLGTLKANGGPTKTCALFENSVAIDAGFDADASLLDQRGATRIHTTDIGAFEYQGGFPGVLDGNEKVELSDAVIALQAMAGISGHFIDVRADLNKDGRIGIPEALGILTLIAFDK